MSSSLSFKQQRQLITDFIKKHASDFVKINQSFIDELESSNNEGFIDLTNSIEINAGNNFYLFDVRHRVSGKQLQIWISDVDVKNFDEFEEKGNFKNVTLARMNKLEQLFERFFGTKKATTTKKTIKTTSKASEIIKLSDAVSIKNGVAFVNTEHHKFDHLMNCGGNNLDLFCSYANGLGQKNQIDHVINAFKVAKKEADEFISELVMAKEAGARNVIDSAWCDAKDFHF